MAWAITALKVILAALANKVPPVQWELMAYLVTKAKLVIMANLVHLSQANKDDPVKLV